MLLLSFAVECEEGETMEVEGADADEVVAEAVAVVKRVVVSCKNSCNCVFEAPAEVV